MKKVRFTQYLKLQLTEIVECYRRYFVKTLGITLLFTIIIFIGAIFLFRYTKFGPMMPDRHFSILGFLYHRYSTQSDYALVDLTKNLFLFFVAFFSIGLSSFSSEPDTEITFLQFMKRVNPDRAVIMLLISVGLCGLDFGLTKSIFVPEAGKGLSVFETILNKYILHLRLYLPMIILSIGLWMALVNNRTTLTIRRVLILYFSLWLINEFAYELELWMRAYVFSFIAVNVDDPERFYLYESFASVPLVAFFITGYHAVMSSSLRFSEPNNTGEIPGSSVAESK